MRENHTRQLQERAKKLLGEAYADDKASKTVIALLRERDHTVDRLEKLEQRALKAEAEVKAIKTKHAELLRHQRVMVAKKLQEADAILANQRMWGGQL